MNFNCVVVVDEVKIKNIPHESIVKCRFMKPRCSQRYLNEELSLSLQENERGHRFVRFN